MAAPRDPDLLAAYTWESRLPTPVPFDPSAPLSPPLSRAPSPRPSPAPPAHLDLLAAAPVSALPSPVARPAGKKTSAFFGSPFGAPPSPPRRASTPDPPAAPAPSPPPAGALFSFAKGGATPTPPPSVRSCASDADAAPAPPRSPPSPPCVRLVEPAARSESPPADVFAAPQGGAPAHCDAPGAAPAHCDAAPAAAHHDAAPAPREPAAGAVIGADVPLRLLRALGAGSFSSVWLARDVAGKLRKTSGTRRLRSESFARKRQDRVVPGLKPQVAAPAALARGGSIFLAPRDGEGATTALDEDADDADAGAGAGGLVAVKMMDRALCDSDDRTRISFVREVEVLRHISHPSIVAYLHSFDTPAHHCLVLEALLGGELFELLDQGDNHSRLTEPLLRRVFGELCQAVGWMHGVGLVHRDLKLENILLTANPFLAAPPVALAALPAPLVKLTDFGLARFIDPAAPALATRCGSEAYAAPEIATGRAYDGRATDAWACGVVLYALAARALPFDRARGAADSRRAYLMRIAQGAYAWPPAARLATPGLRGVVARLLVRDPAARARVVELWDEEWMRGEGAPAAPLSRAALVGKDIPSVAKQEL